MQYIHESIGKTIVEAGCFYTSEGEQFYKIKLSNGTYLVFTGKTKSFFNRKVDAKCIDVTADENEIKGTSSPEKNNPIYA